MSLKRQQIAAYLIPAEILLNIAMRMADSKPVFVYGNIACLILLSAVLLLACRGTAFLWSILIAGVMFSVLPDTFLFTSYLFEIDDIILFGLSVLAFVVAWWRSGEKFSLSAFGVIALLTVAIKLYSQNSLDMWNDRAIYYIGNSTVHLLIATLIAISLIKRFPIVVLLLLIGTFNDFQDNVWGDPYTTQPDELVFTIWSAAMCCWWWLHSAFAVSDTSKRWSFRIIVLFHLIAAIAVGFLYYLG